MTTAGSPATAIVTGGASGIGRALGEALAATGVHVVLADRQAEEAKQVAAGIRARGGSATAAELDVRDPERFRQVVDETVATRGRLDYLFNNAGIGVFGEMHTFDLADWYDVLDVNVRGVVHGVLAVYPRMVRQGSGHIVNTASMAGLGATPMAGSYVTSKHAVVGLSRALRLEGRRHGVKVTVLCPGVVRTPAAMHGGRYGRVKAPDAFATLAERGGALALEPSDFARRALRGVARNRWIVIEPTWWRTLWYVDRLSPWLGARLWGAVIGRLTEVRS